MIIKCDQCNKNFKRRISRIKETNFCCVKCYNLFRITAQIFKCNNCKKDTKKCPSQLENKEYIFCSAQCSRIFRSKKKEINCSSCGKIMKRWPRDIRKSKNLFCSNKCHASFKSNKIEIQCAKCKTPMIKPLWRIKRYKNLFCSRTCNASFYIGSSRSKFEEILEKRLIKDYKKFTISFNNRTILNGLELDIFIKDIKFGIEINGPWHYKNIHGQNRLERTRRNDSRKRGRARYRNIKISVINISKVKDPYSEFEKIYQSKIKPLIDRKI